MTPEAFARCLDGLGPFEPAPMLAVGVSGGADSLALTLLSDAWARQRGGRVVGLTVDHGLRPESAAEAARVAGWLAARSIEHHTLTVTAPRPPHGAIQAWARNHRHALLEEWCRHTGCLHLLFAHHRDDQAETLMLRLARGSGVTGLSAMPAVSYRPFGRLLRPLLDVAGADLRALLKTQGESWIEDPSNSDSAHARVRMRRLMPVLAEEGADAARLAATAHHLGRARQVVDAAVAALMAEAVAVYPQGWARLRRRILQAALPEVVLRALGAVISCIGGGAYAPRAERVERLATALDVPATLGGCRFLPQPDGTVLVMRETRGLPVLHLEDGGRITWDGRFQVALDHGGPVMIAALGPRRPLDPRPDLPPRAVWPSVPAVWSVGVDGRPGVLLGVPSLGWSAPGWSGSAGVRFSPRKSAATAAFRLASAPSTII